MPAAGGSSPQERVRLGVIGAILGLYTAANVVGYRDTYPTTLDRRRFASAFGDNVALRLFYGLPHDLATVAGYVEFPGRRDRDGPRRGYGRSSRLSARSAARRTRRRGRRRCGREVPGRRARRPAPGRAAVPVARFDTAGAADMVVAGTVAAAAGFAVFSRRDLRSA
jgi:hypothetical protein